jgi:hypothetical protein
MSGTGGLDSHGGAPIHLRINIKGKNGKQPRLHCVQKDTQRRISHTSEAMMLPSIVPSNVSSTFSF